ncbi:MAG: ABC transporter ATP-binding protein [Limnochordia bacterium]|jgi:branched-chain amino acid transport system ATP-binding protein
MNILETRGLTKTFGGLTAVDALDLEIAPCEIRAIIGPNGSGKTTTINVISGVYTPDAGQILLEGEPITGKPPHVITATGLARTFQNVRLLKKITVLDNVLVGGHHRFRSSIWQVLGKTKGQREEEEQGVQEAMELLEFVGLDHRSHHLAGSLPYAQQKMVEIARALAAKPRVLLLDEPAAGMNNQEILFLDEIIRQIRAKGITVILIEHVMDLVRGLVDRVTVLNYGRKIAEGTFDEIERDPEVITAYLGKGAKTIAGNQ